MDAMYVMLWLLPAFPGSRCSMKCESSKSKRPFVFSALFLDERFLAAVPKSKPTPVCENDPKYECTHKHMRPYSYTEVFGSTGSVGDGHSRKSVTLDFFNAKLQFGDSQNVRYFQKICYFRFRYFRKPLYTA